MKKFLLLLVGVLFTLSADAWTLYFDIKDTGWTSAPYIYCGKLKNNEDYNGGALYYNKYQLKHLYGTIYLWDQKWDGLTTIFISKTDLGNPSTTDLSNYATKLNGTDAYGQFTTDSKDNWELVDKRLYVLGSPGNNGASSVTRNYIAYSLRGDFTGGKNTWENNDYTFTPQEDGKTYIYDLSSIGELKDGQTFKIYDFTNKIWYGQGDATISKGTTYTLGTGGDIKVSGAISNPLFTLVVEGDSHTLTITEKPSTPDPEPTTKDQVIYFDAVRSGWGTVTVSDVTATVEDDGTKALKKISYNAAEGAKVTFSNGTATYSVNATNGNVYYVESSSIKDGSAYTNYTPTTYYYHVHGDIFTKGVWEDGGWYTQDCMADNHDGTYSFTATIKAGSFGIKRLTTDETIGKENTWINSPSSVTIKEGIEYPAQVKNDNGADFYTELSGKYTIVFNPTTMKVKIVSPTVTPKNYVWRLHTNIITGSWPAPDNTLAEYAMSPSSDNVIWTWEGRLSNAGYFGFKRLEKGDVPSNDTPWFYCNSTTDYTVAVNTPTTGTLKNGNNDTDSGHDWKWGLTPGRYRITLNATDTDAPVITITALDSDYNGLTYVISGTFNGWTAPDTYLGKKSQPFTFTYNSKTKKYVWSYTGTMKNVSFKISNMTDRATDNDPHWGKAFGYSYNGTEVADLTLDNSYQLRRTNVPGEDVFIKFQDNDNNPLTLVNPTFTLDPSNMTLVVKNNPVKEDENTFYWIRGEFSGWKNKAMTFVGDGTWTWEGQFASTTMHFGIMKSASSTSETETGWLSSVSTSDDTYVAANAGELYNCYWKTDEIPSGNFLKNWVASGLNTSTTYRVVFNPTAKTLIIYSLAPVTAHYEALEKSTPAGQAVRQAVNNLFVELNPSDYLPVEATDSYSLQIGGKVVANGYVNEENGLYRFDFLPYFVKDQELTLVASESKSADIVVKSAGKIDINAKAGTVWFEGSKYDNAWYATIKVPFTTLEAKAVYNYPHVTYTRTDQEGSFEANVIWTEDGFTIEVPDAIEVNSEGKYTGKDITFNFTFTPVIPFAVYTAPVASSASLKPAAPATNLTLQMFGGKLNTFELKINGTTNIDVSGVEGVAVENEDAPVEYYNLQGQRVNGELAPGIYIRRQGTTVTKVRF